MRESEKMADLMGQCGLEIKRAQRAVRRELLVGIEDDVGFSNRPALVVKNPRRRSRVLGVFSKEQNIFRRLSYRDEADSIAGGS